MSLCFSLGQGSTTFSEGPGIHIWVFEVEDRGDDFLHAAGSLGLLFFSLHFSGLVLWPRTCSELNVVFILLEMEKRLSIGKTLRCEQSIMEG